MTGALRKRANKRCKKAKSANQLNIINVVQKHPLVAPMEPTLWETFKSHPLVLVFPIIVIPYFLYLSYYFLVLQNPGLVTQTLGVSLRPAVAATEERQFLIVGTISSGTVQVASDLNSQLNLEVGHEVTDTKWHFVRDGTVSWFHGIRFLPEPQTNTKIKAILAMCQNFTGSMGFHPRMYKESGCSKRQRWGPCWRKACFEIINSEWGCGLTNSQSHTCETPFRRTLHQVRHPLRTIESLVSKFCVGGVEGTVHTSFFSVLSFMFPERDWSNDTCIEAAATYVILYNRGMLNAYKKGVIWKTYKAEETSPCQIAKMAGILDIESSVYPANMAKVGERCSDPFHLANEAMRSTKHKINDDFLRLDWSDIMGGQHGSVHSSTDNKLAQNLLLLVEELGYNPNQTGAETKR